jgi:hypothetical protein
MAETGFLKLSPVQESGIKVAVESTCELCREYQPVSLLEIHVISRKKYPEMVRDPSARILVICPSCHRHIHLLPVPVKKQRALVQKRAFEVRRDLRKILGYQPKPVTPQEDVGVAQIYEEYLNMFPPKR